MSLGIDFSGLPWVIFDLDGTLADIKHRLPEIRAGRYNDSMDKISGDTLKGDIYCIYDMAADGGYNVAIVTGRSEIYKQPTIDWLRKNKVTFDSLHMRGKSDFRSDDEVKLDIYLDNFKEKDVRFVVDDRDKVVAMWRSLGLTCLQCQDGDY